MPKSKGWKREPARHSLASKGVKTNYAKGFKPIKVGSRRAMFKALRTSADTIGGKYIVKDLQKMKKYWTAVDVEINESSSYYQGVKTVIEEFIDGIYLKPSKHPDAKRKIKEWAEEEEASEIQTVSHKGSKGWIRIWWD
jgi:predicted lactoylglutathione lyase